MNQLQCDSDARTENREERKLWRTGAGRPGQRHEPRIENAQHIKNRFFIEI
jgi:hypothetical protein